MPPTLQLRDDPDDPEKGGGGGGGLWFLFFLVLLAAGGGGYYWWRRRQRISSFQLHNLSSSTRPLRLSNDGPSAEEFISNNASTDSLPALAANDVPYLPAAAAEADAAAHGLPYAPPEQSHRDDNYEEPRSSGNDGLDPLGAGVPRSSSNSSSKRSSPVPRRSSRQSPIRGPSHADPNTVFSLEDDSD